MLIEDKKVILKDGRTAVLRSPREEDAGELLGFIQTASGETDFLTRYPEEWNMAEEQERAWVRNVRESNDVCVIVCEVAGRLAGNCEVRFNKSIKMGHRANIGIALLKEFWGLGIGSAMFGEMIRITREQADVKQLELEFVEGNDRARGLYEKMGFRIVGFKPNAIRLKDGTLLKEFFMVKEL